MQLLTIIVIVLCVFTVLHGFVTFALLARFRAYQESTALVPRDPDLPSPGERVQPFEATSAAGVLLNAGTLASGATLVGFFTPHCKPCELARAKLVSEPPALPMVAFINGSADDAACQQIGDALGAVAQVAYTARNETVTRAFRQAGYPTFIRVENGKVAASSHNLRDVMA
jgi:thiol-disulfide isomerase/thioredoxin